MEASEVRGCGGYGLEAFVVGVVVSVGGRRRCAGDEVGDAVVSIVGREWWEGGRCIGQKREQRYSLMWIEKARMEDRCGAAREGFDYGVD